MRRLMLTSLMACGAALTSAQLQAQVPAATTAPAAPPAAGGDVIEQGETNCCYAKSEKSWTDDPAGIAWETFLTTGESTDYGDGSGERIARVAQPIACCVPDAAAQPA